MNKVMKVYLAGIFLIVTVFHSCEQIIDDGSEHVENKIVLFGFINPDSLFTIQLTESRSVFGNEPEYTPVTNRNVRVYEGQDLIKELSHKKNGKYFEEEFFPEAGNHYRVEVVNEKGRVDVSAETYIPESFTISSVKSFSKKFNGEKKLLIDLIFDDPEETENFYRVSVSEDSVFQVTNNILKSLTNGEKGMKHIDLAESRVISNLAETHLDHFEELYYTFDDDRFDGGEVKLELAMDDYGPDIVHYLLTIYLQSISRDYYLYLDSKSVWISSGGVPFAEPVQVYSNVENGIGVFAGYASSKSFIHYSDKRFH